MKGKPALRRKLEEMASDQSVNFDDWSQALFENGVKIAKGRRSVLRARLVAMQKAEQVVGYFADGIDAIEKAGGRVDRLALGDALMKLTAWLIDRGDFTPDMLPALLFLQRVTEQKDRVRMHEEDLSERRESKAEAGLRMIEREIEADPEIARLLRQVRDRVKEKSVPSAEVAK